MTRTYVITGSASGIGAATRALLESEGHRVIGVDIREADVVADLATDEGRSALARRVGDVSDGRIDAVIAAAGIGGGEGEPERIIRVNYFGARATLEVFAHCSPPEVTPGQPLSRRSHRSEPHPTIPWWRLAWPETRKRRSRWCAMTSPADAPMPRASEHWSDTAGAYRSPMDGRKPV